MTQDQLNRFLTQARQRIEDMQKSERKAGFASPEQLPIRDHLRTAALALECGIQTEDWSCIGEGLCMVQDIMQRFSSSRPA